MHVKVAAAKGPNELCLLIEQLQRMDTQVVDKPPVRASHHGLGFPPLYNGETGKMFIVHDNFFSGKEPLDMISTCTKKFCASSCQLSGASAIARWTCWPSLISVRMQRRYQ